MRVGQLSDPEFTLIVGVNDYSLVGKSFVRDFAAIFRGNAKIHCTVLSVLLFALSLLTTACGSAAEEAHMTSDTSIPPTNSDVSTSASFEPPTVVAAATVAIPRATTAYGEAPTPNKLQLAVTEQALTQEATTPIPASELPAVARLKKGQITSLALADNLIGDPATRDFYIYLPTDYDTSEKHYPVVYVLHGFEQSILGGTDILLNLDQMLADGEAEEMIYVFIDGNNRYGGSWYLSSPTIGDYESYIVRDLVEHVDANYRTLLDQESRGIIGCSMGGDGALHLALSFPDTFGVAVPISAGYIGELGRWWNTTLLPFIPEDYADFSLLGDPAQYYIAGAAAAAPDSDQPPFYLDMPFEIIDGETVIVQEVYERINAVYPVNDLDDYLDQPVRLSGILLYHGEADSTFPVEAVREFDGILSELGIEHEYLEVKNQGHCTLDYAPVITFLSEHLVFEQ